MSPLVCGPHLIPKTYLILLLCLWPASHHVSSLNPLKRPAVLNDSKLPAWLLLVLPPPPHFAATYQPPSPNPENEWVGLILFSLGRFGVGGAFASIYIATAEMLPTTSRNFGLGLCSVSGRLFGVVTPYIAELGLLIPGKFGESFPLMFIGVGSILCGLSVFLLPETRQKKLPDTISDANNIQKEIKAEEQEMNSSIDMRGTSHVQA